ncbi:MAG: ATP synthase F1 subunit epsilon [Gemmatimonadota bacterium]|nr:ATP synthase F1 subunit epsilon [Gemmatimonadota bacterium]
MADKLHTRLITQERTLFEGEVSSIVAPAVDGYLGIKPKHAPLMSALGDGVLKIKSGDEEAFYVVFGGFLQVKDNRVIVLADNATSAEEIDPAELEKEIAGSRTALDAGTGDRDKAAELRSSLARAQVSYRALRLSGRVPN